MAIQFIIDSASDINQKEAQELGIKVVLASGRPTPGLRHEAKELELDENRLNRIISRYEWENQKYLEKGVIRKFIRFEKLSNIDYQPIFEYDKEIEKFINKLIDIFVIN